MADRRSSDWRDPKFYITLGGFILTCAVVLFSVARSITATQLAAAEVKSINDKLTLMDEKLNKMAISDNTQDQKLDFLKQQFEEYKREQFSADQLRDEKIADVREKMLAWKPKQQ